MKKFTDFIFSMFFTGLLIMAFAIAIAYATIIENDYGTTTAKILIYGASWFEILLAVLCINIVGSVFKHKMVSWKKLPMLLFHISFIVIGIGAMVTRYKGYEGNMHIREGNSANTIVSTATFVSVKATQKGSSVETEKEVLFSPYTANRYSDKLEINGQTIKLKNLMYMPSAIETISQTPDGEPILALLTVGEQRQRVDFMMKKGNRRIVNGIALGFYSAEEGDINFKLKTEGLFFVANDSVIVSGMTTEVSEVLPPGSQIKIDTKKVYTVGKLNFAIKQYISKGKTELVYQQPQKGMNLPNAMKALVSIGNESKEVVVYGNKGKIGQASLTQINGIDISISYGAKLIELPFSLYLKEFQLDRYPGSNSPSSFASEVVLKDGAVEQPFRIFMNNILKYKGYRFFQSSYDNDEMGTILSVNNDSMGTGITYFGYFIMALGMVLGLFNKNSRFKTLLNVSGKLREERKKFFAVLVVGILFAFNANAQSISQQGEKHISDFGKLIIQSQKGRIEPVNTLASQILRKVAKKTSWDEMSPTAVFLDMQANPEKWKNEAIIKVSNPELRKQLGVFNGKYASFNSIVLPREQGGYKLATLVEQAYEKKSNERNKYDKEIIYVDERVNILMNVFTGNFLTIFPIPNNTNNKWVSTGSITLLPNEEARFAQQTLGNYLSAVSLKDWATANQLLQILRNNQQTHGAEVLPSPAKIKLEVFYNNVNIFSKLFKIFLFTGLLLLFIQLATLFNPKVKLFRIKKLALGFIFLLFLVETAGLTIRWYISGHAPWSNGYESMIFISWATCLGGLIFAKRSEITLSLTTVLAGLTLMVAGMSWMSPEITPLVPVLKSYWLIVHVAIITASYGFLGISALLGFLNLLLMIFRNPRNTDRVNFTIKELVNIIQIALIIGLLMLTIGSFLGGVWANESWGRYWGWDPKETWALVTILVYTFITHMHKIPGMKGNFAMSVAALVGFSSVLMTYFGVNYYLSGLHSYAQGEAAPIPMGVYVAIAIVIAVITGAFISSKKRSIQTD